MEQLNETLWPGWETVRLIGHGGFGAVYEIRRNIFGDYEKAALKVISIPQKQSDIEQLYSDGYDAASVTGTFQGILKNIVSEYSMMRKMNGHSHIVSCDDVRYVQHDDGIGWDIFIKMELLTPMTRVIPVCPREAQVIKAAKDLCSALILCKKYDIVHRDIKPQNIFLSDSGDFKLGDFGVAKTVEKTMGGTKVGTYKYMAPEVYNNQPYGTGADIYSLGMVLYWMLNERRMPFLPLPPQKIDGAMEEQARSRRMAGEQIPAPKYGSEGLKRIVLKACAFDPGQRYATAAEMLEDLKKLEETPSPEEMPQTEPESHEQAIPAKKPGIFCNKWFWVGAAACLILLGLVGVLAGTARKFTPEQRIVAIAAAGDNTVGLRADGTVVAAGGNDYGQCSLSKWESIVSIEAGGSHTVGVNRNGRVIAAGNDLNGQSNLADWTDVIQIAAGKTHTAGLREDGTVVAAGLKLGGQCGVEAWTDIVAIAAGAGHTLGLKEDGTVVSAGVDLLGAWDVSDWRDITAIATASGQTVGLKENGTVTAVGSNLSGQCDVSGWMDIIAIAAGENHTVGLRADGTVVAVGSNKDGQCDVTGWTDIIAIAAGKNHTVGLKADGTVVAVGRNTEGQCNVTKWYTVS